MASFFQAQHHSAVVGWSPVARMDTSGPNSPASPCQLTASGQGTFSKMVASLRRLFAERDETLSWLAPAGVDRGWHLQNQAEGGEDQDAAIQPARATMPAWDAHARKSVWGTWQ